MTKSKDNPPKGIVACDEPECSQPASEHSIPEDKIAIPVENTEIREYGNNNKKILTHSYPLQPRDDDIASITNVEEVTNIYENDSISYESDRDQLAISYVLPPPHCAPDTTSLVQTATEKTGVCINDSPEGVNCNGAKRGPAVNFISSLSNIKPAEIALEEIPLIIQYNADDKEDNALERCKRNCKNGIFALDELLEVCRNDPDSILRAYREYHTRDQDQLQFDGKCFRWMENGESDFPSIRQTHGEILGDPKYHYLMVDASTSSTLLVEVEEEHHRKSPLEAELQHGIPRTSNGIIRRRSIVEVDPAPGVPKEKETTHESPLEDKSETSSITILNTFQKDCEKRRSNVSWSHMLGADHITRRSTDSMEKIVLRATAKADKFRQNVNVKNHYSLLGDIVREEKYKAQDSRKSSSTDGKSTESEAAPPKKYFGFIKIKGKKDNLNRNMNISQDKPEEGDDEDMGGGSKEYSETESRKQSSPSTDSYKRRISPVEHPVFQANTEITKYLNNITPHRMSQ